METLVAWLLVLLVIVLAFAFMLGGRRGGLAALGCLLSPMRSCVHSVAAALVLAIVLLIAAGMAWNSFKRWVRSGGPPPTEQHQVETQPDLPVPDPVEPARACFDYPAGEPDADGRRHGDGWYVSQDFADTVNPLSAEKSGQHLGEDWLKRGGGSFAGASVHSIGDGTVIRACADRSYGHVVMIKHPLPEGSSPPYVISLYGHLGSDDVVAQGAQVARGDVIGRIGAKGDNGVAKGTGQSWPEHLHFELLEPTHSHDDDWVAYGYSPDKTGFLNPTDATSRGNTPGGGWIDEHR